MNDSRVPASSPANLFGGRKSKGVRLKRSRSFQGRCYSNILTNWEQIQPGFSGSSFRHGFQVSRRAQSNHYGYRADTL
jgi:hypothetical protein